MIVMKYFLFPVIFCLFGEGTAKAGLSDTIRFMSHFTPLQAIVTDYAYKDTIPSECALVRLENGKIVLMTKQGGVMKPFYVRAIETGYWDTRYDEDVDYEQVFADMKAIGANTAYIMIHWEDVEIADNLFDFSFTDALVDAARKNDLKINWVLFLHAQYNGVPSHHCETAWTFHLDDRDSCNYTMQWPQKDGVIFKDIRSLVENGGIRPLHVYGHREIVCRVRRMLYRLALHYRESDTVIGVQIGNEEGFSFLDESDYNPVSKALFEEWKLKTNKTDYAQFKKEAMNWWWKQFTSAYHEGDPYKILSTNLDAGQAEADDRVRTDMTGTSASFYADGNLDVIGTMFYKHWGYKAILGLDKRYNEGSYNFKLPILIPSEIGIGRFNTNTDFNSFVMHTLERAAQGFGVYCYGEVKESVSDTLSARQVLMGTFENIRQNEALIWEGLPGPGNIRCLSESEGVRVSHLHDASQGTLAMVYWPSSFGNDVVCRLRPSKLKLVLLTDISGNYDIKVYQSGKLTADKNMYLQAGKPEILLVEGMAEWESLLINMKAK